MLKPTYISTGTSAFECTYIIGHCFILSQTVNITRYLYLKIKTYVVKCSNFISPH